MENFKPTAVYDAVFEIARGRLSVGVTAEEVAVYLGAPLEDVLRELEDLVWSHGLEKRDGKYYLVDDEKEARERDRYKY